MTINKWDENIKKYAKHEIPDDWHIMFFSTDMDKECNCVRCGKKIKFGDGYTSRIYHTSGGMGYAECEECYFGGENH